mmetsp:Transcript_40983/g.67256  ORF Transcript_40983/g.67256 Transcript_40983/m.67256 type:complete len:108 (-) Transcript_40983:589-912(-)
MRLNELANSKYHMILAGATVPHGQNCSRSTPSNAVGITFRYHTICVVLNPNLTGPSRVSLKKRSGLPIRAQRHEFMRHFGSKDGGVWTSVPRELCRAVDKSPKHTKR